MTFSCDFLCEKYCLLYYLSNINYKSTDYYIVKLSMNGEQILFTEEQLKLYSKPLSESEKV